MTLNSCLDAKSAAPAKLASLPQEKLTFFLPTPYATALHIITSQYGCFIIETDLRYDRNMIVLASKHLKIHDNPMTKR